MSQDDIEIIEEYLSPSTSKKKSLPRNDEDEDFDGHYTSTPVKSLDDCSITFSQDIKRQPNKFLASTTKSPSKKSSPLPKYSPFRKNSPKKKFQHKPIGSYFQRTPEKNNENSLNSLYKAVKEKGNDENLFESLLNDDTFDLSSVECDANLLTPEQSKMEPESASTSKNSSTKGKSIFTNLKETVSKDLDATKEGNSVSKEVNYDEDDDDIFQVKKPKKKVKKMLFHDISDKVHSTNTSCASGGNLKGTELSTTHSDAKRTDCRNIDDFRSLDLDISMELLKKTSQIILKSSKKSTLTHQNHDDNIMMSIDNPLNLSLSETSQNSKTALLVEQTNRSAGQESEDLPTRLKSKNNATELDASLSQRIRGESSILSEGKINTTPVKEKPLMESEAQGGSICSKYFQEDCVSFIHGDGKEGYSCADGCSTSNSCIPEENPDLSEPKIHGVFSALGKEKSVTSDSCIPEENTLLSEPQINGVSSTLVEEEVSLESEGRDGFTQVKDEDPVLTSDGSDSQGYSYADPYSTCVEAVLEECLRYLHKHRERGICIQLDELGKFINNGSMHQTRRKIYARLLINRKFRWYRVTDLKNYEIALHLTHADLVRELNDLENEGLITSNLDDVELPALLNLLQVRELKQLSKFFRVSDNKTKPELIEQLVQFQKKQSVIPANFFSKSTSGPKKDSVLVKRLKEMLGHCIKLCGGPRNSFIQCLIFVTYPHFHGDPSTRLNDHMNRLIQVQKNEISFPPYTVCKTVVFTETRHFLMYQEALDTYEKTFTAVETKDWSQLAELTPNLLQRMQEILEDEEITEYAKSLPQFLHRFTAGHIYAKALFSSVTKNKKSSDKTFVVSALKLLLDQDVYLVHKRGLIYEELASTLQIHLKDNSQALKLIIKGLKDEYLNDVMKLTLSFRGELLKNRKTNPVPEKLKAKVQELLINIPDPTFVIIQARCLQGRPGFKQVYITETCDGLEFSSVEEMAKSHYRNLGFTQILHDEGGTLRSLIYAAFWDVIYVQPPSLTDHSVFHSPFQTHPLDWATTNFYSNRWEQLSERCMDIKRGGKERLIEIITNVCEEFENVASVVNWNYLSKSRLNLLKDFISALTVKVFLKISWHLFKNIGAYGKAFPDLTMWNPITKQCLFAEVKSPNDRLSLGQKLWLFNLTKMGANAQVCLIRTSGSKKRKLEECQNADENEDL